MKRKSNENYQLCCVKKRESDSSDDTNDDDDESRDKHDKKKKKKKKRRDIRRSNLLKVANNFSSSTINHYHQVANAYPPGKSFNDATEEWIFIIWVPDCPKSRLDFLKTNKIPIEIVHSELEFLNYCNGKNFPFSTNDYFKFKELIHIQDDNLLPDLLHDYEATMHVSEYFWSEKHERMMCAYSLKGKNVENMYVALKIFTEFWKDEITKTSSVVHHRCNKVNTWLSTVAQKDASPTIGNPLISAMIIKNKLEKKGSK